MVIINPLPLAPAIGRSYNHITPFTYRDGLTYIEVLETLRAYIRDVLVPHVDVSFDELEDFVNTSIADNVEWTQEQIADLTDYVNSQVALIINDSIQVQDPVVAGIFADAESDTRIVTDNVYASKATENIIETGRLSEDALNNSYILRNERAIYATEHGAVGDGVTDDTDAIKAALELTKPGVPLIISGNPDGSTREYLVRVDDIHSGGRRVGFLIEKAGTHIIFEPGAVTRAIATEAGIYAMWRFVAPDCTLENATLIGDLDEHFGTLGEGGMGVQLSDGASRFRGLGITASRFWGDGFYIRGQLIEDALLENCYSFENRRQGLSIQACVRLKVRNSRFENTGTIIGTPPSAGIDIEPLTGESVVDIEISDVELSGSIGNGISIYSLYEGSSVTGTIRNITSHGNGFSSGGAGIAIRDLASTINILVDNVKVFGNNSGIALSQGSPKVALSNAEVWGNNNDGVRVVTPNCVITNVNSYSNGMNGLPGRYDFNVQATAIETTLIGCTIGREGENGTTVNGLHIATGSTGVKLFATYVLGTYVGTPVGFGGSEVICSPHPRQTITQLNAAATDEPTSRALVNQIRTLLIANRLAK